MEEKRSICFYGPVTPPSSDTGFEEAVQRAVDARIAEFAASLEKAIRQHGSMLADLLKQELRNWAQSLAVPYSDFQAGMRQEYTGAYCSRCGDPYPSHSESHDLCDVCRHFENAQVLVNPTSLTSDDFKQPLPTPPLSSCCNADVFEEKGQAICEKCRRRCELER